MHLKALHLPKTRILLLERDPHLRAGLHRWLAEAGYLLADDTHDAHAGRPVDLVIAGLCAQTLAAADLQPFGRAVPVIILVDRSAWTGFDFFDAANTLGAVAALQRPFSRAAFLHLIGSVLASEDDGAAACDVADDEPPALSELLLGLDGPNFA